MAGSLPATAPSVTKGDSMASRTQRRAGTKTKAIPGSAGPKGIYQKFRQGRRFRPSKARLTTANEKMWRR